MKTAATLALRSVPRAALSLPPAWRRRLGVAIVAAVVLASGYLLWFRDSSLAKVEEVYVSGLSGPQSRSIRTALERAGLDMTTLHVNTADLRAAVADYPVVRSVSAEGDFPDKLRIHVELNLPVAILQTPSGRKPVAADGLFLTTVPTSGSLPVISAKAPTPGERVTAGRAFDLLRVVALAPVPLRRRIGNVRIEGAKGIVAEVEKGPELIFGNAERLPAKWAAATRVLAAAGARGATYIDVRLPERPTAGGLPTTTVTPLAPAGAEPAPSPATTPAPVPEAETPAAPTPEAPATTVPAPTETAPANPQPQVQTSPQPSTTG